MNDAVHSERGASSKSTGAGPRISPLRPSEWSGALRLLLTLAPGGTARPMNIFSTLARHKSLFWPWLAFAGKLLRGKLTARDRELVILRTAYRCGCAYERHHHRDIALEAGFRADELAAIEKDPAGFSWSDGDRLVLLLVDELHDRSELSDATWAKLRERYGETELIELVMLAGHYHMVAFTLNALRVEVEAPAPNGASSKPPALLRAVRRMVLEGKRQKR